MFGAPVGCLAAVVSALELAAAPLQAKAASDFLVSARRTGGSSGGGPDLSKPGKSLTDKVGSAASSLGMKTKEVEDSIHMIKGKPDVKVVPKLSGGRTNPDVFIDKNTGDVFWNYQGRVGAKIGNVFSPPRGR